MLRGRVWAGGVAKHALEVLGVQWGSAAPSSGHPLKPARGELGVLPPSLGVVVHRASRAGFLLSGSTPGIGMWAGQGKKPVTSPRVTRHGDALTAAGCGG